MAVIIATDEAASFNIGSFDVLTFNNKLVETLAQLSLFLSERKTANNQLLVDEFSGVSYFYTELSTGGAAYSATNPTGALNQVSIFDPTVTPFFNASYYLSLSASTGVLSGALIPDESTSFGTPANEANGYGFKGTFSINASGVLQNGIITEVGLVYGNHIIKLSGGGMQVSAIGIVTGGTVNSITVSTLKRDTSAFGDYYLYDAIGTPIADKVIYSATGLTLSAIDVVNASPSEVLGLINYNGNDSFTGTSFGEPIGGLGGNDTINAGAGNDTLEGGAGIDVLNGGTGNDLYFVDIAKVGTGATATIKLQDTVTETATVADTEDAIVLTNNSGGTGNTPLSAAEFTVTSTITLVTNVEGLNANALTDFKLNITGNAGNNYIIGNNTANILDGLAGEDTLDGGAGNDTYIVDLKPLSIGTTNIISSDLQDKIIDSSGDSDTLKLRGAATFTNAATISLIDSFTDIENLDVSLTGATKFNLIGSNANNYLTGNTAINTLEGREGNDTLDGGAGADSMNGGNGDDMYYIDNVGDVITDSDGIDNAVIKLASGTYVLAADSAIENISIGNTAALNLTGNGTANTLTGNAAANILDGGAGADNLNGGDGADTYIVDDLFDVVTETNAAAAGGIDLVKSKIESITLGANLENLTLIGNARFGYGNALANTITGNDANNEFYGDAGKDTLKGGKGDDTYDVDLTKIGTGATAKLALQDTIIENLNEGADDTINLLNNYGGANNSPLLASEFITITTFTLAANIENLYAGFATDLRLNLTGNTLENQLDGNNTANILDGGAGADVLLGGAGDDTYIVDLTAAYTQTMYLNQGDIFRNDLQDDVIENAGAGNDTLKLRGTFTNTSTLNLTAGSYYANVEGLDISLTGAAKINLTGDGEKNNLIGNAAANTIDGGAGNDTLNGGAGADSLVGGAGDDTYVIDVIADIVNETGADANDTIRSSIAINLNAPVSTTIPALKYANIENVTLTGAGALNLTGNAGANVLNGNDGANIIDGGVGFADEMNGGKGADTYIVNNVGDVVYEALNALQGGGIDLVKSKVTFDLEESLDPALINYLENLTLTDGTANGGTENIDGAGNALANILTGNAGNNLLEGEEGIDTLLGKAGNDTLDGGDGADKMTGGDGSDTYYVDSIGDVVTETNGLVAGGIDTVNSEISYILGARLENLTLIGNDNINGTGNTLANIITGNAGNNILDGGASAIIVDTLIGSDGSDTYVVDITTTGIGNATTFAIQDLINEAGGVADVDTLKLRGTLGYTTVQTLTVTQFNGITNVNGTIEGLDFSLTGAAKINLEGTIGSNNLVGNAFTNRIEGFGGDDTLNGGAGIDTLVGGAGNDTYVIDTLADIIDETGSNDTDDTVQSANLSLDLSSAKFNGIIENAGLLGATALNLTGNGGANELTGNAGANILDGKGGADDMDGGKGNDTYIVGAGDVVEEEYTQLEGGGIDLVKASTTFVLSANIENLTLTSVTLSSDGYGNAQANILTGDTNHNTLFGEGGNDTLIGNAGNDNLIGGDGNDILNGGAGVDFYTFDTTLNALTNKDAIQGFNHNEDTIQLSQVIFSNLDLGVLNAANYRVGAAATTADHRIINNAGNLYYDADGTGSTAAVQFATLTGTVGILGADDFIVF